MNRFVLDEDPVAAAQMHCDKHVVKMILEEAQMLSTAHRVIDHFAIHTHRPHGKRSRTEWVLGDNALDGLLYRSTHVNHPCSAWVRASSANYDWARRLLRALSDEYTYRYGREHAVRSSGLEAALSTPPSKIRVGPLTPHPLAMPDEHKQASAVDSYRELYFEKKRRFAKWERGRPAPSWYTERILAARELGLAL